MRNTWDIAPKQENGIWLYENTLTARRTVQVWGPNVAITSSADKWVYARVKVLEGEMTSANVENSTESHITELGDNMYAVWARTWAGSAKNTLSVEPGSTIQLLQAGMWTTDDWQAISQGYVDLEDLEEASAIYDAYHTLGGNGAGTRIITDLRQMRNYPLA